ncbi:double-stranded RNA binding motif-containing protein [Catovirus CTV1]|uniref:Double-stranded RNA binding motif-containing protein n=1 Tax=Catovirus CTV1 TaxID=1977631 RepID=A0A1V0S9C8_9VIRU|nr:double-stranded RNA binding motif-containing protein [Catovirus CTV1]
MNDYTITVIENTDQFNKIYPILYSKSTTSSTGVHVIGLDCEFITEVSYKESFEKADWCIRKGDKPIVCKLQIAAAGICIILDLCRIGKRLPDNLINMLKSESWIKCGIGISNDMDYLSYQYDLGNCNGSLNISTFCKLFGLPNPNLENVYNLLIKSDEKFHKNELKGRDWSKDMTVNQVKYASEDAIASYKIGIEFLCHMSKSLETILFNKTSDNNINNLIEIKVSNENYVGALLEYVQKNKLAPPSFDFEIDNIENKFYCRCSLEINQKIITVTSDGFTNKKDSKHNVCKKMLSFINKN